MEPNTMKISREVFGTTLGVGTKILPPCKDTLRKFWK